MPKSLPDSKLLRAMEQVDRLREQLRREKIRRGHLKFELERAKQRTTDAVPKSQPEQHAC